MAASLGNSGSSRPSRRACYLRLLKDLVGTPTKKNDRVPRGPSGSKRAMAKSCFVGNYRVSHGSVIEHDTDLMGRFLASSRILALDIRGLPSLVEFKGSFLELKGPSREMIVVPRYLL